ncbi:MAG: hypothetical protein Q7R65_03375 [bacterium]|nr:hypothetical protein [bacterium]
MNYYGIPSFDIGNLLTWLYRVLVDGGLQNKDEIIAYWYSFYLTFSFVSICVSFLILIGIAYSSIRLYQIRTKENKAIYEVAERFKNQGLPDGENILPGVRKWQQVEAHASSENSHERRLAVLEADIILDELVYDHFGEFGETLGERLKKVDRSDFQTIDKAWEAHRIRNAIAHEGSSFELSERELKNILKLYEEVFKEFNYI